MKKILLLLIVVAAISIDALADIPGPNKKPRPTPQSTVSTSKTEPTPAPGPTGEVVKTNEAQMTISVSRYNDDSTIVINKRMLEKLNALAKAGGTDMASTNSETRALSGQTIVGGIFLSLAFIFGGVWLARSKGPVSKPALGVLLFTVVGLGATLVIGNVPPPKRIPLNSAIINEKVLGSFIAEGKVNIELVDWESKDDIMLVLPRKQDGGGEE